LLWDVTGSVTFVVIFIEKSNFPEILATMKSVLDVSAGAAVGSDESNNS
jgi:hypothetical protein